jgi:signal transduction histidine kinase
VNLAAERIGRLPPDIEARAYYIAAEATTNAVKHANASQIEIKLAQVNDALQLTITDDGPGGAAFGRSMGLQCLRDRADRPGGAWVLRSITSSLHRQALHRFCVVSILKNGQLRSKCHGSRATPPHAAAVASAYCSS